ncbi:MAG: RimK family alpha-L-glutamate ligase [Chloroflexota bacterium]
MKGWILYREALAELKPESYEMHRFVAVAKRHDIELDIIRPNQLDLIVTRDDRKSIRLDGKVVSVPDFVIPRLGSNTTYFALAAIRHLERLGVTLINSSSAIETVKDKLYTQQILAASGLPVPKTMLAKFPLEPELVQKQLGFPVVVKTLSGAKGSGVYLAETMSNFIDLMTLLETTNSSVNIIFQEFIAASHGHDLRVFVVGGRVVACMERVATDGSFKANISRGGDARAYALSPEVEMLSIEVTRQVGLDIAGVDLLFDDDHFKVCEVNSSPGFKGIETAYPDYDIADMILEYTKMRQGVFHPPVAEPA